MAGEMDAKILLGAMGFCVSVYLLFNTVPKGNKFSDRAFALYSASGLVGAALSVFFLAYTLFD